MSYYDPFYPSIEATRNEITRSILALEDKLRLRKEIDMDIELNKNYHLAERAHLATYQNQLAHRQALVGQNRFYSDVYDRAVAERFKYAEEQELSNLKHLSKLQQLERQRLQLNLVKERQRINAALGRTPSYLINGSPYKGISSNVGYEEDDTLIKKYEDGTRARELKYEIQSYNNSKSKYNSATKNIKGGTTSQFDRSPYSNLKYDSQRKVLPTEYFKKNENDYRRQSQRKRDNQREEPRFGKGYENNLSQQRDKERNNAREPKGILKNSYNRNYENKQKNRGHNDQNIDSDENKKLESRGRSKSHNLLNSSKGRYQPPDFSPYRSYLKQNSDKSPRKSNRSALKRSTLEKSKYDGPPQVNAIQKIKNRLKLSQIVYKDSKFKNVKHELSHLFNTYDCEFKLRKEIKDKINSHPLVLKKHAMVVE